MASCESAMVPNTKHCLVLLIFVYYFFTKTFMMKEAVHKQAHSRLVKDQVHPDDPLWTAPLQSPQAWAWKVGSEPSSPTPHAPTAPCTCSSALPQAIPILPLRSFLPTVLPALFLPSLCTLVTW